jgi:hypothetical protein
MNISTHFNPPQPMTLSSRPSAKPAAATPEITSTEAKTADNKAQAVGAGDTLGTRVDTKA